MKTRPPPSKLFFLNGIESPKYQSYYLRSLKSNSIMASTMRSIVMVITLSAQFKQSLSWMNLPGEVTLLSAQVI
ncbi:MAG TPA: hypothetical protein V6C90_14680 [Coleofasciculaceae cyanobacterium]